MPSFLQISEFNLATIVAIFHRVFCVNGVLIWTLFVQQAIDLLCLDGVRILS